MCVFLPYDTFGRIDRALSLVKVSFGLIELFCIENAMKFYLLEEVSCNYLPDCKDIISEVPHAISKVSEICRSDSL